jgi:hypothetical protein
MRTYDRVLRADLFDSKKFLSLPTAEHKLAFIALIPIVDDFGNVAADPYALWRHLRDTIHAKTEEAVMKVVSDLCDSTMIAMYEAGGRRFLHLFKLRPGRRYISRRAPASPFDDTVLDSKHKSQLPKNQQVAEKPAADLGKPPGICPEEDGVGRRSRKTEEKTLPILVLSAAPQQEDGAIPGCPVQSIIALYHRVLPTLPRVKIKNEARETAVRARWRQIFAEGFASTPGEAIKVFEDCFAKVAASKFLTGRVPAGPGRAKPFVADLTWIMNATNFAKIAEREYT